MTAHSLARQARVDRHCAFNAKQDPQASTFSAQCRDPGPL